MSAEGASDFYKDYHLQGSICETRKGPNSAPIRRGIDYLAYANVFENENRFGQFYNFRSSVFDQKLSKGTSTDQDLLFEPITRSL